MITSSVGLADEPIPTSARGGGAYREHQVARTGTEDQGPAGLASEHTARIHEY